MKIICTIDEYSRIIRSCQRSIVLGECKGCALENICNQQILEDAVQLEVEAADHADPEESVELDIEYIEIERTE